MGRNIGRAASFTLIAIVYIVASAVGIVVFNSLQLDLWLALLIADVAATAVTFIFSLIFNNASVYDPYWSVQPIVIVLAIALYTGVNALGVVMIIAVCAWGIRLTANWAYTFRGMAYQDWRYTMLKEKTGAFYPIVNFLGIHLFPTLVVYLCVLPVVYGIVLGAELNVLSIVFCALSFGAMTMQGVADVQMHKFRKNGTGGFIRVGLWKYSRHPNYLGEILMWWGMAFAFICAVPSAWYFGAGALVNTLMFLIVSVPMADKRQSKKVGFDEYKSATRILLPIKK
ncbi:MAG: DUF1295 domain-containing protein [Clostridia bacterium]|nr:DUF1295 domain-containing protein [Clostridia bacterium]